MRHFLGIFLAGGILLATASDSNAQFSISIGGPGYGYNSGYSSFSGIGVPGLYNSYSGYSGIGVPGLYNNYNSYSNSAYLAGPGVMSYSSGYQGFAPGVAGYGVARPYYGGYGAARPYYGGYGVGRPYYGGYRNYGYGVRPYRGLGGLFR